MIFSMSILIYLELQKFMYLWNVYDVNFKVVQVNIESDLRENLQYYFLKEISSSIVNF